MQVTDSPLTAAEEPSRAAAPPPPYAAFFQCFNRGRYFEAHEVLEPLWLQSRGRAVGPFYKALIQVAGGFVHLEKERLGPAAALLRSAAAYLEAYPSPHQGLDTRAVRERLHRWYAQVVSQGLNPLRTGPAPFLACEGVPSAAGKPQAGRDTPP